MTPVFPFDGGPDPNGGGRTAPTPAAAGGGEGGRAADALLEYRVNQLQRLLQDKTRQLAKAQDSLAAIYASPGWKLLLLYYGLRNRMLPPRTRRREAAKSALHTAARLYRRLTGLTLRPGLAVDDYACWIRRHEPKAKDLERQRLGRFVHEPLVSVVVPVCNTPVKFLEAMIQSVLHQTYANWELCLADGASPDPSVKQVLLRHAYRDPRVKVTYLDKNEGIAGNSNAALALAAGEFVALLDHDDTLAPFALYEIVKAVNEHADADVLYSDEDKLDARGSRRSEPYFKPDWSPDLLRSCNYVCHLAVFRRELLERIGGFRPGCDGSQDYDLILRATERARRVVHVPQVLYHWRMHDRSTAGNAHAKTYAYDAAKRALRDHLARQGLGGRVDDGPGLGTYQVTYPLPCRPLVSILIPTCDHPQTLADCVGSLGQSGYENYEVLLIENNSKLPETFALYERLCRRPRVRLVTWTEAFNYARVNNYAAALAQGEVLVFLNNDVQVISPDWLERMLEHALRPGVGAVGAKLYYPDDTVQHAGVVVGMGVCADHVHKYAPRHAPGYRNRLVLVQNVSALTAACLMVKADVFRAAGGFDERFVLAFNDVDLCLRLREKGYLLVWTPYAELYHHESKTRGYDDTYRKQTRFTQEQLLFHEKWAEVLRAGDPYYNKNLSLSRNDCSLRI